MDQVDPGSGLLTVYIRVNVQVDLQVDKSSVVVLPSSDEPKISNPTSGGGRRERCRGAAGARLRAWRGTVGVLGVGDYACVLGLVADGLEGGARAERVHGERRRATDGSASGAQGGTDLIGDEHAWGEGQASR
jgi:hypothetical protein